VWSDRITAAGAFWGIVTGFLGNAIAKVLAVFEIVDLPVFLDPFVIGISLSVATILIVSKMGRATDGERSYRAMIHRVPSGEIDERKLRQTLRFPKMLMVTGALTIMAMIVFYARPYASGQKSSSPELATLETGGGELVLAIGYGAAMILAGAIAYRVIKKDYALNSRRNEKP
jgi:sodium/pantothenate symporter